MATTVLARSVDAAVVAGRAMASTVLSVMCVTTASATLLFRRLQRLDVVRCHHRLKLSTGGLARLTDVDCLVQGELALCRVVSSRMPTTMRSRSMDSSMPSKWQFFARRRISPRKTSNRSPVSCTRLLNL